MNLHDPAELENRDKLKKHLEKNNPSSMKKEINADIRRIAYCGLYCGSCRSYLADKCPGCAANEKASWCKIRSCCLENKYQSCADCKLFADPGECKKFNNFISKIFAVVLRSDRQACISRIRETGYADFATYMAGNKQQTIRR